VPTIPHLSRRQFIGALPILAGGVRLFAGGPEKLLPGCQTNAWKIAPNDFPSFLQVLDQIKSFQYAGFETGFRNVQAQFGKPEARRQIEATGLRFAGIHIFLFTYDPQTAIAPASLYQRVAEGGAGLGANRLILSGGPVNSDGKLDEAALHRKSGALMEAATYARQQGLGMAYHNELRDSRSGGIELEALLRETDPALVSFFLDAGHAYIGGVDVPAFFRQHHTRIVGLHLRDYRSKQGAPPTELDEAPLGEGDFDLKALAKAVEQSGWSGWVINEEDYANGSKPGSTAIKVARESLRKAFHV
jgi:inosose dehydratase